MTTSPNTLSTTLDAATLRELVDSGRAPRMLDVRTLVGRLGDHPTPRPLP